MYSIFGHIVGEESMTARDIAEAFNIEYGTDFSTLDMEREYVTGFLIYDGKGWVLYWDGRVSE